MDRTEPRCPECASLVCRALQDTMTVFFAFHCHWVLGFFCICQYTNRCWYVCQYKKIFYKKYYYSWWASRLAFNLNPFSCECCLAGSSLYWNGVRSYTSGWCQDLLLPLLEVTLWLKRRARILRPIERHGGILLSWPAQDIDWAKRKGSHRRLSLCLGRERI